MSRARTTFWETTSMNVSFGKLLALPPSPRDFSKRRESVQGNVLDVGSGVGDVAMPLAKLVGPTGEVVGI
jgi:hypothetical protein